MPELNLKQITDKLNTEFTGSNRKLVFWYDTNADFVDDIDTLELANAKVLHLAPDNQFYTKYFLECVDITTNYLVYAPFAKPAIRENHLADTIKYSKEFFADRASLLALDLGIDDRYKPVIQHYIKFFGEKKRTQAFYDLELETFNQRTIEAAMMSVLCKCKTPSYEEVLRIVLTTGDFAENSVLAEFEKFDLTDAFWQQAQEVFGYTDEKPTLEKLAMTLFVTHIAREMDGEVPAAWKPYVSFKGGNASTFLDSLMNSYLYSDSFDQMSKTVYDSLKGATELAKLPLEALLKCGVFAGIDQLMIRWITERLELEDVSAKLGDSSIPELIKLRSQGHFGKQYRIQYAVLENAWNIISGAKYTAFDSLNELVNNYTGSLYQMDRYYRYFCYYLDKLEDHSCFEKLQELVENIYTNDYLSNLCVNWNEHFAEEIESLQVPRQVDFYHRNLQNAKDQMVVIISDALRYEVGATLLERLQADEKCTASMRPMVSVLPSITRYGMAALLPHKNLTLDEVFNVSVDGQKVDTLEQRQAVLQQYKPNSRCVQYDEIKNMSVADLRSIFTRQDVVYIYHNQIDARGDKTNTENEVFCACEEAVEEICALIRRLTTSANKSHFIVTADHGFLYKRSKMTESEKIGSVYSVAAVAGRRYLLADSAVKSEGVSASSINATFRNGDCRMVSYPMGADVFKTPGSGVNYVHGGCSPQEMLIPVIDVKTEKGHKETTTAQIALVSLIGKITNLITSLDFVQTDAVSDVVKETTYRICFVDDRGEVISNEYLYTADRKDEDTMKRMFRVRFSFKNKKYDKKQKYYLVASDDKSGLEVLRREVVMDIAFADDFGFGF